MFKKFPIRATVPPQPADIPTFLPIWLLAIGVLLAAALMFVGFTAIGTPAFLGAGLTVALSITAPFQMRYSFDQRILVRAVATLTVMMTGGAIGLIGSMPITALVAAYFVAAISVLCWPIVEWTPTYRQGFGRNDAGQIDIRTAGAGLLAALVVSAVLAGCGGNGSDRSTKELVGVDITGMASGSVAEPWKAEATATAARVFDQAMADGVDEIDVITIGTNTTQAGKVATIKLKVEGNTPAKRDYARDQLRRQFVGLVQQILDSPVTTNGTDVATAFQTAAGSCTTGGATCNHIWMLSDLEDTSFLQIPDDDAATESLVSRLPRLNGIPVTVVGVGASGGSAETVARVRAIWPAALEAAGAGPVQILRSY